MTLSDDLVDLGEKAVEFFRLRGYKIHLEHKELGFPYTPAFVAKRQQTTIIVEVMSKLDHQKVESWVHFAKSVDKDTRLALVLAETDLPASEEENLRKYGVGAYIVRNGNLREVAIVQDLALNVSLPPLANLPGKLRPLLGPAYDQFERSQWREGFEEACQVLEREAKKYLWSGLKSGRVTIIGKKGKITFTKTKVNALTLGRLQREFSKIQNQNHADSQIEQALAKIVKDRNAVVHHKSKPSTERRLRKNVGRHMWVVIDALKFVKGLSV